MVLSGDGVRSWRYWSPEPNSEETDPDRAQRRLEELLHEVVPAHMIADVPIGVFLSGGIDSTAVVASLDRPRTFAIGFDDRRSTRRPMRRVAAHLGTEHHERQVPSLEAEEALSRLPAMFDEPFADLAAWSNTSSRARRDVSSRWRSRAKAATKSSPVTSITPRPCATGPAWLHGRCRPGCRHSPSSASPPCGARRPGSSSMRR
jgi:asparagine synthetase B (glutamine-hydrolysing)